MFFVLIWRRVEGIIEYITFVVALFMGCYCSISFFAINVDCGLVFGTPPAINLISTVLYSTDITSLKKHGSQVKIQYKNA